MALVAAARWVLQAAAQTRHRVKAMPEAVVAAEELVLAVVAGEERDKQAATQPAMSLQAKAETGFRRPLPARLFLTAEAVVVVATVRRTHTEQEAAEAVELDNPQQLQPQAMQTREAVAVAGDLVAPVVVPQADRVSLF